MSDAGIWLARSAREFRGGSEVGIETPEEVEMKGAVHVRQSLDTFQQATFSRLAGAVAILPGEQFNPRCCVRIDARGVTKDISSYS